MRDTEKDAETQAEGEACSIQEAWCEGPWDHALSRRQTHSTTEPPRRPILSLLSHLLVSVARQKSLPTLKTISCQDFEAIVWFSSSSKNSHALLNSDPCDFSPSPSIPPFFWSSQWCFLIKNFPFGQPGWLSGLAPPSAQGVTLETRNQGPHRDPCLEPASPSACVSALLCVSHEWINKI